MVGLRVDCKGDCAEFEILAALKGWVVLSVLASEREVVGNVCAWSAIYLLACEERNVELRGIDSHLHLNKGFLTLCAQS